jgi:5-methyltetrahydropteroyltriglutamate--homocysteine methyltransferase
VPIKQAVIAPSAISLIYPQDGIDGYPREQSIDDLVDETEADVRRCLERGAYKVQLDFTEGRLSVKLDPSKALLRQFIELNNRVLERFSDSERERIGIHTCPGSDQDSAHSLDVRYHELLPSLLQLKAGNFYIQMASEKEYIPVDRLGSADDCGFAPLGDDTSTPRETAFAKIRARVEGTALASEKLGS